jgi:hypothetical protein
MRIASEIPGIQPSVFVLLLLVHLPQYHGPPAFQIYILNAVFIGSTKATHTPATSIAILLYVFRNSFRCSQGKERREPSAPNGGLIFLSDYSLVILYESPITRYITAAWFRTFDDAPNALGFYLVRYLF